MKKVLIVIFALIASFSAYAAAAPMEIPSEVCAMAEDDLHISQQGNLLVIDQPSESTVMIFTAVGRCVYQSTSTRIQVQLQPGIYVIRTASKTVKFVVK